MESDERVRLPPVFDDLNVGTTLHHPETGAVLDVNERTERLYGYSREALRSMDIGEITPPSSKYGQAEAVGRIRAAAAGTEQSFDWQIVRSDGDIRWIQVSLNATTLDGEPCVVAEIRDITESRRREQRLRLLSRIIRHNLRNRSNVLIGFSEQIRESVENETLEAHAQTLVDVSEEIGSMSESVEQLEEVLELDAADRTARNVGELVTEVASEFETAHPRLSVSVDAPPDLWVLADRGLRYAFDEALSNAVEHGTEAPNVDVTVEERMETARVRIADDGPPIPEKEIRVLDENVEKSSTYHGSGVGLWVMQWAISSIGGDLAFERRAGGGNVVTITLPKIAQP
jgi:PAS domain S-box-containing protein